MQKGFVHGCVFHICKHIWPESLINHALDVHSKKEEKKKNQLLFRAAAIEEKSTYMCHVHWSSSKH